MTFARRIAATILIAAGLIAPAAAQEVKTPYWASLRADEVNMRVGPGEDYRIAWVFKRKQLPLKVLRLKEGWRLVEDPEGAQGWMLARFLTRERGAIVQGRGPADIRDAGNPAARLRWRAEPGVTGKLGECVAGWCEFDAGGHKGWVEQRRLWGAGEP
ncbi:MAG TPA: SH3 domain-containing protein [Novosphingobium sp.]|nr:SH3 domain-containing protein [Novosphingobium sp.]HMP55162.1 SH3 domain-containing protein [Novosphingobium sp.]